MKRFTVSFCTLVPLLLAGSSCSHPDLKSSVYERCDLGKDTSGLITFFEYGTLKIACSDKGFPVSFSKGELKYKIFDLFNKGNNNNSIKSVPIVFRGYFEVNGNGDRYIVITQLKKVGALQEQSL